MPSNSTCRSCGWGAATADGYCLECAVPETFEDTMGCDMCGAHIDDPCDCFDPQGGRRTRTGAEHSGGVQSVANEIGAATRQRPAPRHQEMES